jgi:hypothetical protein
MTFNTHRNSDVKVTPIIGTNRLLPYPYGSRSYEKEQEGENTSLFRARAFLFLVT